MTERTVANSYDRVTGRPAPVYTPPEDLIPRPADDDMTIEESNR